MKKALIIAVFVGSLVTPMVVSAAWYNPFSWFKKAPASIAQPVKTQTDTEIHTAETVAPTALPVPKPVFSNNITVADPKLQSQINTLIQQNSALQTQLASLTGQYNTLVAESINIRTQLKTANDTIINLKAESQNQDNVIEKKSELIINRTPTNDGTNKKGFVLENNSDSTQKIISFYVSSYGGLEVKAYISTSPNEKPTLRSYDTSQGSVEVMLPTPIILSPHNSVAFWVYYDKYIRDITGVVNSGSAVQVGFPININ